MMQCVNDGKLMILVKKDNLFSSSSDTLIKQANYKIRDFTSMQAVSLLPNVKKLESPLNHLKKMLFSAKEGYPLEFEGKNINEIKDEACVLRNDLCNLYFKQKKNKQHSENFCTALLSYCNFLQEHKTSDAVILSLQNLRVTSDAYVPYNFKETMDEISDLFNYNQIEVESAKRANEFLQKEIEIIKEYFTMQSTRILLDLARALTNKMIFFLNFSPHLKTSLVATWQENIKFLHAHVHGPQNMFKVKIDNVSNAGQAKKIFEQFAYKRRKGHVEMNLNHVGYDFDFVLHKGTNDSFITLESLIPNEYILQQIERELEDKKVYIITANVDAHHDGFISAFLYKYLGSASEKIIVISTRAGKSEEVLKNGISQFYDDNCDVLFEVIQNAKFSEGYENLKLFWVQGEKIEDYERGKTNIRWSFFTDKRIYAPCDWYEDVKNEKSKSCLGCTMSSAIYEDHKFDETCKVTCISCRNKSHSAHSTYTRRYCLPKTRKMANNTMMKDWAFDDFIQLLQEGTTYRVDKKSLYVKGQCSDYVAKFILCTSAYELVQIENERKTYIYLPTDISKSFSKVTTRDNVEMAVKNCQIIKPLEMLSRAEKKVSNS